MCLIQFAPFGIHESVELNTWHLVQLQNLVKDVENLRIYSSQRQQIFKWRPKSFKITQNLLF